MSYGHVNSVTHFQSLFFWWWFYWQDFGRFPCLCNRHQRQHQEAEKTLFSFPPKTSCPSQCFYLAKYNKQNSRGMSWFPSEPLALGQAADSTKWLNSRTSTVVNGQSENVITCLSTADWCIFKSKRKQSHPRFKHQRNQTRLISPWYIVGWDPASPFSATG